MRAKTQIETEISKIAGLASDAEKIVSLKDWLSTHLMDESNMRSGLFVENLDRHWPSCGQTGSGN
jgi:hypothetical protein